MDQETINIIIGAQSLTIIVLIVAMYLQSRGLANSFPPAVLGVIETVTAILKEKAASTPSQLDDQAVAILEGAQQVIPISRPKSSAHPTPPDIPA